jgi:hypothetical protein
VPRFATNNVAQLEFGIDKEGESSEPDYKILVTFITHGLPGNNKDVL